MEQINCYILISHIALWYSCNVDKHDKSSVINISDF